MSKNAIQKYAIWARNELIEQVKQRAYQYGISAKGYGDENATIIAGRVLSADEKRQRAAFVSEIKKNGFEQAVEDVAYTWFNRFVALRFMEVNDYLPTHVRVFSDASGGFNPEILKDVLHLELEGLDKSKVSEMLNANQTEELYRYLLLTQCNALNAALPEMFEKLGTYTEMLLPNNILKQESVLAHLVTDIPEEDWKDAVQIIGWLYQYYNTEPKQAVFDGLKKNVKITKEKIPAATQLFTPDWIVRYMVENSLGRLWLESHPNPTLKANWKYYLDEAEQTPEVAEKLRVLRSQSPVKSPEDIRLIDPCMGSGHILVYAFDVLMQIYESEGYNPRDAAKLILEKNIYGLDIDRRAYQLAYFSLMMKARQYNRRIFTDGVKPQVYHPAGFPDGEEYGSLVKVDKLEPMPELPKEQQMTLFDGSYDSKLNAWNFKRLLAQKYDVVVTNPPYMGNKSLTSKLSEYANREYPNSKNDLYGMFIEKCSALLKKNGYQAMITMHSWMFISTFLQLRESLMKRDIVNMAHLGARAFEEISGEVVQTTAFVLRAYKIPHFIAPYIRLVDGLDAFQKETAFLESAISKSGGRYFSSEQERYANIPSQPISYWISDNVNSIFKDNPKLGELCISKTGMTTGDNDFFLRYWYEILATKMNVFYSFYNKGGGYRKWYGNIENVINWDNDGFMVRNSPKTTIRNPSFYFRKCISWNLITTDKISVRDLAPIFVMGDAGPACYVTNGKEQYYLGLLNSKVADFLLKIINPTINYSCGVMEVFPVVDGQIEKVTSIVEQNILLSRSDWDSFETSWDFKRHPLLKNVFINKVKHREQRWEYENCKNDPNSAVKIVSSRKLVNTNTDITSIITGVESISIAFKAWEQECENRFNTLKQNEEELNRIFIEIYGLQDELTPEVEDKDVTVRKADLGREIRSLISYAVGCMFGRYSLDVEGLQFAGGDWNTFYSQLETCNSQLTFLPDKDNILPICDDEYFDDDIMGRFVDFVRVVYGAETLEENLKFIADALGGRGTPREVIRNYFLNDFYKDHCKIYKKRPIYWLFDSGSFPGGSRKNGFKALVYLHRYQSDLLAKLRTDYVHEQQERYRTQLSHIAAALNTATGSERARLLKQQDKLSEQLKEITVYEEKVHHLADQHIEIDLDDGVKKNYKIFADVLAKI